MTDVSELQVWLSVDRVLRKKKPTKKPTKNQGTLKLLDSQMISQNTFEKELEDISLHVRFHNFQAWQLYACSI